MSFLPEDQVVSKSTICRLWESNGIVVRKTPNIPLLTYKMMTKRLALPRNILTVMIISGKNLCELTSQGFALILGISQIS